MKLSTTDLNIELIITGLGPLTVLVLLTSLIADCDLVDFISQINAAHLIILTILSYIIGIIWDTLLKNYGLLFFSNSSKNWIKKRAYRKVYKEEENINKIDLKLIKGQKSSYKIDYKAKHFDYSRSKVRICRGWTINSLLFAVVILFYGLSRSWPYLLIALIVGIGLAFFILSYLSWYILTLKEYKKYLKAAKEDE